MEIKPTIAIHGGAGTLLPHLLTPEKEAAYKKALRDAIAPAYDMLLARGNALDAVETAVKLLEDTPLFNAGKGSVFTNDGGHEMDASIMCGKTKMAGAVAAVCGVRNPVQLARVVMEKTEHVMLSGEGAIQFAKKQGLAIEPDEYFYDEFRYNQLLSIRDSETFQLDHSEAKKLGTVGAVAIDVQGNLAAATSTGGMTNKRYGRIGDTPIIGAGTWADNQTCAISCTGHGEYFIREVVAHHIHCLMLYKNMNLAEACREVLFHRLSKEHGEGGLVAIDSHGNVVLDFNSDGMYRAYVNSNNEIVCSIYRN